MSESAHKNAENWQHKADDLAPLLEYETFTFRKVGIDIDTPEGAKVNGLVAQLVTAGLIKQAERVRVVYQEKEGSSWVWRYEWADGVREQFRRYRETRDGLLCGCRKHIPDARGDPEGVVSCKFCGREYDEAEFREMIA
jgi:hypothetical protein